MFEASPSLRAAHRDLLALSTALENTLPTAYCLTQLLSIPDQEPILVINPATRTGILGSISGIDLNFHLHTLLLEHFPGEDGQPGRRLSPEVRELLATNEPGREEFVTGIWNLYNWTALDADLRLPEGANQNSNNWIWNEAGPADIAPFEGRRAILLGPAPYARTWSVHRSFSAIEPRLEIEKVLTPQEVEDFLTRMAAAR